MNRKMFVSAIVCLLSLQVHAGIERVLSLQQTPSHAFNAICVDGTFQTVTAEDVRNGSICSEVQLTAGLYRIESGDSWYCTEHKVQPEYDSNNYVTSVRIELAGNCGPGSWTRLTCDRGTCTGPTPNGANGGDRMIYDLQTTSYTYKVADRTDSVRFSKLPDNKSLAKVKGDFRVTPGEGK